MAFKFRKLDIPELLLITPDIFSDARGSFIEVFKQPDFARLGMDISFRQVNYSSSAKGVLRGLHYQNPPFAQSKLIRVISGEIFDVAVDIRRGSPRYGKWAGVRLEASGAQSLFIPEGFAHGFCVLSDTAEVEYFAGAVYSPQHERGIIYNDPSLGIRWPVASPILSEKDAGSPLLANAENGFVLNK